MKTILLGAAGSDVAGASDPFPRNLREINGHPLLDHVIVNLGGLTRDGRLVAMLSREESRSFHTGRVVKLIEPSATVVTVGATNGAACTALLAIDAVGADESLVVTNADQVLDVDLDDVVSGFEASDLDAGVVVFDAVHPRWSYVRLEGGMVIEASEKRPISRNATAGFFWFRRSSEFFDAVMAMIHKGASVGGRFYTAPALNEMILGGAKVGVSTMDRQCYWSLHDDAGIRRFEAHLQMTACAPNLSAVQALIA